MGIFTEKFADEQDILDIFICPICHDIVEDPVVPQCVCQAIYCRTCIDTWLVNHQICPHCESSQISNISPMGRILQDAYFNLKMKCETLDCDAVLTIKNHSDHKLACPKISWTCEESCGLEANLSIKAGHKCLDWLKGERVRLTSDLKEVEKRCHELESELNEERKAKIDMERLLLEKSSVIESIKKRHETDTKGLKEEVLSVRKQLVKVNKERDELHLQLDQLKKDRENDLEKFIKIAKSPVKDLSNESGIDQNGSHHKNNVNRNDALKSLIDGVLSDIDSNQGQTFRKFSGRQFSRTGARERMESVESTQSEIAPQRRSSVHRKPPLLPKPEATKSKNDGLKKVINFKLATLANEDIKSKVTSAVNEADSKGMKGFLFKREVARIMDKLMPCNGPSSWMCYSSDLFDASRAKMKRETFCAFIFDSNEYYVYENRKGRQ